MKDDSIWLTISNSAGIDSILFVNVYTARQPLKESDLRYDNLKTKIKSKIALLQNTMISANKTPHGDRGAHRRSVTLVWLINLINYYNLKMKYQENSKSWMVKPMHKNGSMPSDKEKKSKITIKTWTLTVAMENWQKLKQHKLNLV